MQRNEQALIPFYCYWCTKGRNKQTQENTLTTNGFDLITKKTNLELMAIVYGFALSREGSITHFLFYETVHAMCVVSHQSGHMYY